MFYRLYRETREFTYPVLKEHYDRKLKLPSKEYDDICDTVNSQISHFHLLQKLATPESHRDVKEKPDMSKYLKELNMVKKIARNFKIPYATKMYKRFPLPSRWFEDKEMENYSKKFHIKQAEKSLSKLVDSFSPNSIYKKFPSLSEMSQEEILPIYCLLDLSFPSKVRRIA